jgi:hypothetical protein
VEPSGPHPPIRPNSRKREEPERQEIMSITEAQTRRALRHADIPWDREVDDPREDAWVVHDHLGLLGGLPPRSPSAAVACVAREDFFADLGLGSRRARARPRDPVRRTASWPSSPRLASRRPSSPR